MNRHGWVFTSHAANFVSSAMMILALAAGCSSGGDSASPPSSTANVTWNVTPAGGTFQTPDGRATLTVPPNAVAANITLTPQFPSSAGTLPTSYAVTDGTLIQLNPVSFNTPVTLQFRIPASVANADVPFVRVFRKPDGSNTWQALPTTVDVANRIATAQTSQFSGFGVFTANIGPNEWAIDRPGGTFTGLNDRIGLTVAQNAVNSLYRVRYTPIAQTDMDELPAGWRYVEDSAFDFVWSDVTTQFNPAATFKIRFAGLTLPCDRSLVAIFTRTDFGPTHQWNQNGTTGLNAAVDEATVLVNRLQQHALFCPEPVLPVHTVTRAFSRNANDDFVVSLQVSRLEGSAFVPVVSQSYVREQYSATLSFGEGIVNSGSQVSAESLYVVTSASDTSAASYQLVALNLASNAMEVIDAIPHSTLGSFIFSPGISPDGSVVASKIQEMNSTLQVTRRALRVYSRQNHALLSETDLATADPSDVEAVGNNGVVVLSDRRLGGNNVTVVRNGSVQMQFSGTIPRLNPLATKVYAVNGQQIEERDLTNGQQTAIPINPVDYAIQSGGVVHYRQTTNGCELVRADIFTGQETVVAPSVDCPSEQNNSAVYMLR